MSFTPNPFIFGDPVSGEAFFNRKRELQRLAGRIAQGGSALLTAEPRTGKTSLLLHLQHNATKLFGPEAAERMVFRYLDGHTMSGWDAARFWQKALQEFPAVSARHGQDLTDLDFLERFFKKLEAEGRRLVLLLDEFGAMQGEPGLHCRAVYGPLRSLATRYRSFSLVVASRRTLTELNYQAREFSLGSPYFNFLLGITLAPFPQKDVEALLGRGADRFAAADRAFVRRIGGQHPYFVQAAAYYLWEALEDGLSPEARYEQAAREFYREAGEATLKDIWEAWPPYMQVAFTLAALDAMPALLGRERAFNLPALLRDLPNLSSELARLEARGFLRPAPHLTTGYEPHAEVMLWYLADELTRVLRPQIDLKTWLARQQWDGPLTQGEKETLGRLFKGAGEMLQEGAKAFIKAAAEGAARGITGKAA